MPLRGRACGGAASIEGADAPYEDWLRQCFYPLTVPHKKRTSHMRGSYTLPEFVLKTKGSRFGAMLLDEERGRHGPPAIEGANAPYAHCFAIGLSPLFRSSFYKTKGSRFGAMLLDEERVFGESRHWSRTNVRSCFGCVLVGIALLQSNGRKGRQPLQWLAARAALALHPKSLRQIGYLWFFKTNSGSINEPLMGGSFFCGERGGNRSIGEANLRKGHQPLQWKRPCRPLLWKRSCRLLQWERYCRPPLSTAGRTYSRPARLAAILRLLLIQSEMFRALLY